MSKWNKGVKTNLIRRIRFKIAEILDKKESYCWVNLFMWAWYNDKDEWESQICREKNEGTPNAYCGKCECTGRFYL